MSFKIDYETLSKNHIKDLEYLYGEAKYYGFLALMAGDIEAWEKSKSECIELSLAYQHKKYFENGGL